MTTIILGIVGPVLGLSGVVLGIWYGQRHWRRERDDRHGEFYQTARREAYTGLWEVVQDAHLNMRASLKTGLKGFPVFLTDVNSFIWKHGLYIDDADRELAQEYLYLVYEFLRIIAPNEAAKDWAITSVAVITESGPFEQLPTKLSAMTIAQNEANHVRDQLAERIRLVLGAAPSGPSLAGETDGKVLETKFNALVRQEVADYWRDEEKGTSPLPPLES